MAAHSLSNELTEQIRANSPGAWDGFITKWWGGLLRRGRCSHGDCFVTVRTCYPSEGWSPPSELTFGWEANRAPISGEKVRVELVRAIGFTKVTEQDVFNGFLPIPHRYVIDGVWQLLLSSEEQPEELADQPHIIAG